MLNTGLFAIMMVQRITPLLFSHCWLEIHPKEAVRLSFIDVPYRTMP
jgi:hypothetical protein